MVEIKLTDNVGSADDRLVYSDDKELAMILSIYDDLVVEVEKSGQKLSPEQLVEIKQKFEWDYLSPNTAYSLIDLVELPKEIQLKLSYEEGYLNKKLVHKQKQENVLLSEYEKFGKSVAFRGYFDWAELDSDHLSDHVDGIKLFEIIRQGMLASFHINNLKYDSAVALTNLKIDYFKYVETFTPFVVHIIPVNKADGGSMFILFGVYQGGQLVAKGYLGTYTFRSKSVFQKKRQELIEGVLNIAKKENWPIITEKTI